jgi:hypothetical protein
VPALDEGPIRLAFNLAKYVLLVCNRNIGRRDSYIAFLAKAESKDEFVVHSFNVDPGRRFNDYGLSRLRAVCRRA